MKQRVFLSVGLLGVIAYIAGLILHQPSMCDFAKPLPVVVLIFWVAGANRSRYRDWMLTGLVLSLVGDVFLLQDPGHFLHGLAYFLCAHLAYVTASFASGVRGRLVLLPLFALWGAGVFSLLCKGLGEMFIPVVVYMLVICTMMWRAACAWGSGRWGSFCTLGALLFGVSDSLLAIDLFYQKFALATPLVMLTYWGGQTLLAASVDRFEAQ